jgi:hypothetical protein
MRLSLKAFLAVAVAVAPAACDTRSLQEGPPCHDLDEVGCAARKDCVGQTCGGCGGVQFACYDPATERGAVCPLLRCATLRIPCAILLLDDCEVRGDCHSVFADPGTCDCVTPGCCLQFSACAQRSKADCSTPPICREATPACGGDYVPSVVGGCYEGCVQSKDCAP